MGSSSSDEDGDEKWRAAVNSVAGDCASIFTSGVHSNNKINNGNGRSKRNDGDGPEEGKSSNLKLCQTRAQDLLHRYLDKTVTVISSPESQPHKYDSLAVDAEDDIRLFRRAPLGVTLKPDVERPLVSIPRKKPRIPPGQEIDEKSAEFQCWLQSVAVDGAIILAEAEKNRRKALARLQAKEATAQIASKKEEERVVLLKQQRGEKWLPSIAKEMSGNIRAKTSNMQNQLQTVGKKHVENDKIKHQ